MNAKKIKKLRAALRAAEERGFNTALAMIAEFSQSKIESVNNSLAGPVLKEKLAGPYQQIIAKTEDLRTSI